MLVELCFIFYGIRCMMAVTRHAQAFRAACVRAVL